MLVTAILYIMPAYIANAAAVIFRGKTRIDQGQNFFDGRPILGKGKTIEGFLIGFLSGSVYAIIQFSIIGFPSMWTGVLLAFGAMTGDVVGSFVKRRLNLKSGELAPFLDQWDFVFGGFFFVYIGEMFGVAHLPSLTVLLIILVTTVFIHLISNIFAYLIGMKEVPW